MKRLWILPIIAFILAIIFVVPLSHHRRHKVSELNFTNNPKKPERIVSLAPNLTEILFALGLDEKIVAVSNGSDYPPEAANKERIGTFWQPNTESIIASKPDLVVTLGFEQHRAVADSLNRLGYQVLTLKIENIEQLLRAINKIGNVTGKHLEAEGLIMEIKNRILSDERRTTSDEQRIKVLWVVQVEPLRVAGRNTFINELIELAGGKNAIGPTIQQYPPLGTEELLVSGAEVILQSAMGTSNIAEQQQAAEMFWSRWANLPAVKNNRIHIIEPDTVLRLGPRLPQGIELIARYLHPDNPAQKRDVTQQIR